MKALENHGEYEFPEWLEALRDKCMVVDDLRAEVDEWLVWLDRCFDRGAANKRLQNFAR